MSDFSQFELPESLLNALNRLNIKAPTPIQAKALPLVLSGQDLLASSKTGTGKTFAFALPTLAALLSNPSASALILSPTRELAMQLMKAFKSLMRQDSKIPVALLIGGDPIEKQLRQIKRGARLIIATPGRINDHLRRRTLSLKRVNLLVLDETDQMLELGFKEQIDDVIKHLPKERQTLLFSATFSDRIIAVAQDYLNHPMRVAVGSAQAPIEHIQQEAVHLKGAKKYAYLSKYLESFEGSALVFVKTKAMADQLTQRLKADGLSVGALHGDLRQRQRTRMIETFRSERIAILIATNIAARGLDIPHIQCVINYDLPQSREDYIHRIGRTARAGASGVAITFVAPHEDDAWAICQGQTPRKSSSSQSKRRKPQRQSFSKSSQYKGRSSQSTSQRAVSSKRRDQSRGVRKAAHGCGSDSSKGSGQLGGAGQKSNLDCDRPIKLRSKRTVSPGNTEQAQRSTASSGRHAHKAQRQHPKGSSPKDRHNRQRSRRGQQAHHQPA